MRRAWLPMLVVSLSWLPPTATWAADQPQWGQRCTRNMVSAETGLPTQCDPASGAHVRWVAELGTETYSTPIVAGGCVFIGTNNARPRDPQHPGDCGVFMCFDEKNGRLRWQLVVPKLGPSPFLDWPNTGMVSSCSVEDGRIYMLTNRNEVVCLDPAGMANGNDGPYRDEGRHMGLPGGPPQPVNDTDADIIWLFDIDRELGVHQHDGAHCSILIDGPYLYLNTSNGVDDDHLRIPSPEAPALIVLDKASGRLVARDHERMAPQTIHCTWSSPALGEVNGRRLVFFGGGDGLCYAFEAPLPTGATQDVAKLKKVWWFDCDPSAPKENIHRYQDNRQEGPINIMGMPVFDRNRVYVAGGGDLWHGRRVSWLKCIDATKTGDLTQSGEIWSYEMKQHCMATPAVHDGLVFIADCRGRVHCLDADTGKPHWVHSTRDEIWASTLVTDGKVFAGNSAGELWVLAADKEKRVLGTTDLGSPIHGTPTAANGVLYVATMRRLYAIAQSPSRQ